MRNKNVANFKPFSPKMVKEVTISDMCCNTSSKSESLIDPEESVIISPTVQSILAINMFSCNSNHGNVFM